MKKLFAGITIAVCTCAMSAAVFADTGIRITANPTDEFRHPGETALFIAEAEGFDGLDWTVTDPQDHVFTMDDLEKKYPDLVIEGKDAGNLFIGNLTEDLNGWAVTCTFREGKNTVETEKAHIWVSPYVQQYSVAVQPAENQMYRMPESQFVAGYYDENGNYEYITREGNVFTTHYWDGSDTTSYPDGLQVYHSNDGSITQYDDTGYYAEFRPDGYWFVYDPATDLADWGYWN